MIDIRNLSVTFATVKPFENFSFQLRRGEKCVLVGPSGRGKTTLLNVVLGFVEPESGEIRVGDLLLSTDTVHQIRHLVGYLPQEVNIDVATGKELLFYPFTFRANRLKMPTQEQIRTMLERLRLSEQHLNRSIRELSGGERQRLLLAAQFLLDKPLLLFDEPTSALDAESTASVIDIVDSLTDTTVLSVSHDPRWIEAMSRKEKL